MAVTVAAYPQLQHGFGKPREFSFWRRQDGNFQGTGVASFNDYTNQNGDGSTACGPGRGKPTVGDPNAAPQDKIYAAGLNDLSDIWAQLVGPAPANLCGGTDPGLNSTSLCHPGPFSGPSCPQAFIDNICNKPTCFQITNQGIYEGKASPGNSGIAGVGTGTVKVQLVDACPRNHLNNFCNTDGSPRTDRADERCNDNNRQFDIDTTAFPVLTSSSVSTESLCPGHSLALLDLTRTNVSSCMQAGNPQDLAISMVQIDCPPPTSS